MTPDMKIELERIMHSKWGPSIIGDAWWRGVKIGTVVGFAIGAIGIWFAR